MIVFMLAAAQFMLVQTMHLLAVAFIDTRAFKQDRDIRALHGSSPPPLAGVLAIGWPSSAYILCFKHQLLNHHVLSKYSFAGQQ